jgi:hypothetical protein
MRCPYFVVDTNQLSDRPDLQEVDRCQVWRDALPTRPHWPIDEPPFPKSEMPVEQS